MLFKCWASVVDLGQTLKRPCFNVAYLVLSYCGQTFTWYALSNNVENLFYKYLIKIFDYHRFANSSHRPGICRYSDPHLSSKCIFTT